MDIYVNVVNQEHLARTVMYQLPFGDTFEATLEWQPTMREKNPQAVHTHGSVLCYETLKCQSGALCLDWREICDGIQ
jgi:hypothetical protein